MNSASILIPVFNEASSLMQLTHEILEACDPSCFSIELIFIDDGSSDDTWKIIFGLAQQHQNLLGIRLTKNFGKAAALSAGVDASQHDVIISIDGDLQDDPGEIPKLVRKLNEGFDIVVGWKQHRQDNWRKRASSTLFNWLVSRSSRIRLHDHNCGLKAMRRHVFEVVDLSPGMHRFIAMIAGIKRFRITEIPVHHRARLHGRSKYGWGRIPQSLFDLLKIFLFGKGIKRYGKPFRHYQIAETVHLELNEKNEIVSRRPSPPANKDSRPKS